MAIESQGINNQQTRDELGTVSVTDTIYQIKNENLLIEEGPLQISSQTVGHSLVLSHYVNGKIGNGQLGMDGQQIVLGSAGRTTTLVAVTNPLNTFIERFNYDLFKDTTQPNTADWNTTLKRLSMSTSSSHSRMYNTVTTFKEIYLDSASISRVEINATEIKWGNDIIKYFIRTSASYNWQEINLNNSTTIDFPGTTLYLRIVFLGNGGSSTYLENLRVYYE